MPPFRVVSLVALSCLLLACGSAPGDEASSGSKLTTDSSWVGDDGAPECSLMWLQFDGVALFHDLEKTLAPELSSSGRVVVPDAITATDDQPFTSMLTVLAAQMSLPDNDNGSTSKPVAEISGGVPDPLDGDRAAHALYDAMTRGVDRDDTHRVSRDGLFECHIEGWKGGDLYVCTFSDVVTMRGVSWPSHLCVD